MIKIFLVLSSLLLSANMLSATLDDVTILDATAKDDGIKLKLHATSGPPDSFFFVDITSKDKDAFMKISFVIKKLLNQEGPLSLNIPSFSIKPNGSYYRSEYVTFSFREK